MDIRRHSSTTPAGAKTSAALGFDRVPSANLQVSNLNQQINVSLMPYTQPQEASALQLTPRRIDPDQVAEAQAQAQ